MKIERDYLTAGEIRYIVNLMLNLDNDYMTREYVKVLTVADICTDIKLKKGKDENGEESLTWSEDVYNEMWKNGEIDTLYSEIRNIGLIEEIVSKYESVYSLVKNKLEDMAKGIEDIDVNDLIGTLAKNFKELTDAKAVIEEKK